MQYELITAGKVKKITPCKYGYQGKSPNGDEIDFTNYYMRFNGKPFYAASGEMHIARIDPAFWEDEIIKMKMAGITMISSYLFWIHHEEIKGEFDWTGSKNIRAFLELCKKQKMWVLLRVGPFSHGECRNGGFPDWLYGAPFDVRSNDSEYLFYVERYFAEIARQVEGMMFKDGGPIVSVQIENEYEHASSPWELTTENSNEWTISGNEGPSHFKVLKEMLIRLGLIAPLYTTTAWGGACAPEEYVLPLWGGYAFWPWIFYGDDIKEHPATTEFLYRDFHNNNAPKYYNFDPEYPPEEMPFVCCEMGGGMANYYRYRFQLPFESVEALANVKAAGGCNFLGYYMFHGGTNPKGKKVTWLNECALPKMSYDYQAAVGEYGQLRPSYHRVKLLHFLYEDFADVFCDTMTCRPEGADDMKPEDVTRLRYAARSGKDASFLFLNNYQDHVETQDKKDFSVLIHGDGGQVRIPHQGGLSLGAGATAILPYRWALGTLSLRYATVQPITRISADMDTYFFYTPEGMEPSFCFEGDGISAEGPVTVEREAGFTVIKLPLDATTTTYVEKDGCKTRLCVLSRKDSLRFWRAKDDQGRAYAFLSEAAVLFGTDGLRLESIEQDKGELAVFPKRDAIEVNGQAVKAVRQDETFAYFDCTYGHYAPEMTWTDASSREKAGDGALKRPVIGSPITSTKVVNARAKIRLTHKDFEGVKQALLRVRYDGDIGYAFMDGDLISDNFSNGAPWEFGLKACEKEALEKGLYLYISPLRKNAKVHTSTMAARFESVEDAYAKLHSIEIVPVFECKVEL